MPTSRVCHSSVSAVGRVRVGAMLPTVLADRRHDQAVRQLERGDVGGRFGGADPARGGGGAGRERVRRERWAQRGPVQQAGDGERDPRPVRRHVERQPARRRRRGSHGKRCDGIVRGLVLQERRLGDVLRREPEDHPARCRPIDHVQRAVVSDREVGQRDVQDEEVLRSEHAHVYRFASHHASCVGRCASTCPAPADARPGARPRSTRLGCVGPQRDDRAIGEGVQDDAVGGPVAGDRELIVTAPGSGPHRPHTSKHHRATPRPMVTADRLPQRDMGSLSTLDERGHGGGHE